MPKTLEGISAGPFKKTTVVPQPGESRKAADIEVAVRDLLNNTVYLLALVAELTTNLKGHNHAVATDTAAGFMSPADRQRLFDLAAAIQSHTHALATTAVAGFMSPADKTKLNAIDANAQTVTRARVLAALGILSAKTRLPDSSFSAGQVKDYKISLPGMTQDDLIFSSQYMANDGQFSLMYHAIDDAVQVFAKNLTSTSKTMTPGEISVMAVKF